MSTPQVPVFSKTVMAIAYPRGTSGNTANDNATAVNAAIAAAPGLGADTVMVAGSLLPYNASLVTFNNAIKLIREGGNPVHFDAVAYGADWTGNTDCSVAVNQAITSAQLMPIPGGNGATVEFPAGQFKLTSPIICLNSVNIVGNSLHGFGTELVPVNTDTFKIRGIDNGGQVFRVHVRQLAITCTQALTFMPFEVSSGYSCSIRDVFVNNSNNGMTILSMNQMYLYNVNIWAASAVGTGIDVDDTDLHAYNLDIENFQTNVRIGANQQTNNGCLFYGGYMERFGAYGIKFVNTKGNCVYGMYIIAPNAGAIPVGFQGTALNNCQYNKIIGGNLIGNPAGNSWAQNANSNNNAVLLAEQTGVGDDGGQAFCEFRDGTVRGLDLKEVSPPALAAGNSNNYNLYSVSADGNPAWVRFSANAAGSTLTGLANGRSGHPVHLVNVSANALTLAHQNANSIAANRFTSPTGANVVLNQNDCATLIYDGASTTWRIVTVLT